MLGGEPWHCKSWDISKNKKFPKYFSYPISETYIFKGNIVRDFILVALWSSAENGIEMGAIKQCSGKIA